MAQYDRRKIRATGNCDTRKELISRTKLLNSSGLNHREIGEILEVSSTTIQRILTGDKSTVKLKTNDPTMQINPLMPLFNKLWYTPEVLSEHLEE